MQKPKSQVADLKKLLKQLEQTEGADSTSIGEWRRRREAAEAKLKEFEAAEREGTLLRADEVREAVEGFILQAREQLMGIPSQVQDRLAGMSDARAIGLLLDEEITRALLALSKYQPGKPKAPARRRKAKGK